MFKQLAEVLKNGYFTLTHMHYMIFVQVNVTGMEIHFFKKMFPYNKHVHIIFS